MKYRTMHTSICLLAAHLCYSANAIAQGSASTMEIVEPRQAQLEPHRAHGEVVRELPPVPPEERARREKAWEEMEEIRENAYPDVPVDPAAVYRTSPANPPSNIRIVNFSGPQSPGDFTIYRNSTPGSGTVGQNNYNPNEPTGSANGRLLLYTGNMYARLSPDHGVTWSAIDPYVTFPNAAGGLGGDFVTYYDRTRGIMLWYLQYFRDGNGNNVTRLAVSKGQDSLSTNTWRYYDFSPQALGYPNSRWFDYPDIATSSNMLFVSTNVLNGNTFVEAVVMRISLDELAAGGTLHFQWLSASLGNNTTSYRLTTGATGTMYFATHVDNNTIRIYSWGDTGPSAGSVDRDIDAWQTDSSIASSPDGTNWLGFDKHRIIAAWVSGNRIGLMWNSAAGGAYAQPNVRYVRINTSGLNVADQGVIWNGTFAFAYPSAHPNDRGDVGGTIHFGGRSGAGTAPFPYPSMASWISDGFNGGTIAPLESVQIVAGTNGPSANRWGDYISTRRHPTYGNTWVDAGYILNGSSNAASYEPHEVWFGREVDQPPGNNTVEVDGSSTTWESGSPGNPYHTVARGSFATVPGDTVNIHSGSFNERPRLNRSSTLRAVGGLVVIGQ